VCGPPHMESWRADKRSSSERGYGSRWRKARAIYLQHHPLCVMCERDGRVTAGSVVDHIRPHKGDPALFWSEANWQTLCATHHSSDKQMLERSGQERTRFDAAGRVIW
jgi:5-methylcytosine-specific restriction protein A